MVLPISGPDWVEYNLPGPVPFPGGTYPIWVQRIQGRYRQAKPFDRPLPYLAGTFRIKGYRKAAPGYNQAQVPDVGAISVERPPSQLVTWAYNKAYERLKEGLRDSAELAVSLAERKQAMSMMSQRLLQIADFTLAIKQGRFNKAAEVLGVSRRQLRRINLRSGAKSASSNYLEFHFGWSPLVGDIGNAINFLQAPIPPVKVRGSATSKSQDVFSNPAPWWWRRQCDYKVTWRLGCEVAVDNPNLWLANSLGFVNPATVAWELVPFSFVVDWFVNVSDFLSGFTDFAGLTVVRPYRTRFWSVSHLFTQYDDYSYWGDWTGTQRWVDDLPGPSLTVRAPWRLSARRGAAAAALLVQLTKSIR